MDESTLRREIIKVATDKDSLVLIDALAVEEPFEIRMHAPHASPPILNKNISITMRTPGNDADLSVGFLFTEGIIKSGDQITDVTVGGNIATISVDETIELDLKKMERHFYTTSSCGVCGKSSLDAIRTVCSYGPSDSNFTVSRKLIMAIPDKLNSSQEIFQNTGGLHAAALFHLDGSMAVVREDVGRHNALDKVIGACLMDIEDKGFTLPLSSHLLLLSGRASFELIQKAVMAGIQFVCAVGAPSSMAVQLAEEHNVTLIGFLNHNRFNIYSGKSRVEL